MVGLASVRRLVRLHRAALGAASQPRSCMVTMQMDYGEVTRDGAPAYDPIQPQVPIGGAETFAEYLPKRNGGGGMPGGNTHNGTTNSTHGSRSAVAGSPCKASNCLATHMR